jgi:hypothetical protein
MKSFSPYKYFACFTLIANTALIFFTFMVNFLIDPFTIHLTPLIQKFNQVKTELDKHDRLYKAIEIGRKKPEAILFGSSRVMAGIDPNDLTDLTGLKAYNGGFKGASFEEIYHYFEHALYEQPHLKSVVIGLDFFAFGKHAKTQPDFSLNRLKTNPVTWKDFTASLFSYQSLKTSLLTYKKNLLNSPLPPILPHGLSNPELSSTIQGNQILEKGEIAYINLVLSHDYHHYQLDEEKIALFKKIVNQCQKKGIDLKIFFCPCKAMYWEGIYRKQLWPLFEELKRHLSTIYPIWDFSGFNCVTTQSIENKDYPFYFECSHFRPYLGKILLEKMFNRSSFCSDFGSLLTPETVEHTFTQMREQAEQWISQHDILKELETLPPSSW